MSRLRAAWKRRPLTLAAFLAVLALAGFFAVQLTLGALGWKDRPRDPQPWMSPGMLAHMWHVPKPEMLDYLGLDAPPEGAARKTLGEIAAERGISFEALLADMARSFGRAPE